MNLTWKAPRHRRLWMWLRGYRIHDHGMYRTWVKR